MGYQLIKVETDNDWRDYHALRRIVLWEARGRTGYDDQYPDEYAPAHHPLLLKLDARGIGTTRLDDFGDATGAVRMVTIAPDMQRQGHGRVLSELVEERARHIGLKTLFVNAAPEATVYYEKTGWEYFAWNSDELTGFAADCRQMRKILMNPALG